MTEISSAHDLTSLRRCAANPIHKYFSKLATCPWCDFEKNRHVVLIIVLQGHPAESVDFHELWRKVEEVLDPGSPSFPFFIPPPAVPLPLPRQVERKQHYSVLYDHALF